MLPVIANANAAMPVTANAAADLDLFNNAFAGFSGASRFLRPRKMDFALNAGGTVTTINNGDVIGVLLGVAPYDHCTWYERSYNPGQEPASPDLCWVRYTPDTFPEGLPAEFRRKVNINGAERWAFRIARRTVWALLAHDGNGQAMLDIDNPVIMDMTSASMWGKSDTRSHSYKWSGLKGFCAQWSTGGRQCNPSMFWTQILIDPVSSVAGVVVFRPVLTQQGTPSWLDNDTYSRVIETALGSNVADMLKVTEILTRGAKAGAPVQSSQPAGTPVQPTVAQPVQQPAAQPAPQPAAPVTAPMAGVDTNVTKPAGPVPPTASESASLLARAQEIIAAKKAAASTPAAEPAQPASQAPAQPAQPVQTAQAARPAVADAATEGLASIMSSLSDMPF